ncbi:MAG: hypothetical protein DI536_04560 [Archangium gephyra]|uniref:Uncharacterized protein n=1 Tax=Archangium gephyra TaxID=48 RepID=A0A2W5W358_9BACT|nr:MAG: hypothetical protein DI536_04560 [Archangium gephyra]
MTDAGAVLDAGAAIEGGEGAPWELDDAACAATSRWVAGHAGVYGSVDFVLRGERHPPNFFSASVFFVADDPVVVVGKRSLGSGRIVFSSCLTKKMTAAFEFDCVDAGIDTHVHGCFLAELP